MFLVLARFALVRSDLEEMLKPSPKGAGRGGVGGDMVSQMTRNIETQLKVSNAHIRGLGGLPQNLARTFAPAVASDFIFRAVLHRRDLWSELFGSLGPLRWCVEAGKH